MKIALLFGMFSNEIYSEVVNNSKGGVQYAADALQKSFLEGLGTILGDKVKVINLPYIGSYPLRYKKTHSPFGEIKYVTQNNIGVVGENIRFLNFSIIKMYSRYLAAKAAIKQWCFENEKEKKIVVIYAIHSPFLKACVDIKKMYSNSLKIVLIVPDLPEHMGGGQSFLMNFLRNINDQILNDLYGNVDGYVLLSKYMAEQLPIDRIPWVVVEGIFNHAIDDVLPIKASARTYKQILYTGTLAKRYGIVNLVKAVAMIDNPNIRLVVCGAGDAEAEIMDYVQRDERIIYKGQLSRDEVLKLQKESDLLVNPRTPEGEFTKFSFPSKTMEYLASGIPTLLYPLPGIPDEYYKYCFCIEELGVQHLSNKISDILQLEPFELQELGRKARHFIFQLKNPIIQSQKVVDLINSL